MRNFKGLWKSGPAPRPALLDSLYCIFSWISSSYSLGGWPGHLEESKCLPHDLL